MIQAFKDSKWYDRTILCAFLLFSVGMIALCVLLWPSHIIWVLLVQTVGLFIPALCITYMREKSLIAKEEKKTKEIQTLMMAEHLEEQYMARSLDIERYMSLYIKHQGEFTKGKINEV